MKGDQPRRHASRRDDPLRPGLLALGAGVIACAAVAVAAAGEPLRDADGGMGRITVSPWVLLIPVVAAVILIIIGLAGLKGVEGTQQRRKKPLWLTVVGLVLLVAVISRFRPDEAAESDRPYTFEVAEDQGPSSGQHTAWPTWLAVAAGGMLAAGAVLVRRRAPSFEAPAERDAAADALRAVEASLADLTDSPDPRQAVIAAYARLLDGLRDAGAGREPAEAPFEHVARVLGTLGVRPEPLRQLTALFAEARFSTHPITEAQRAAALTALEDARADLRGVAV